MRNLVLWGFHPAHGRIALKLAAWTPAVQRSYEMAGWKCAAYKKGESPDGLNAIIDQHYANTEK